MDGSAFDLPAAIRPAGLLLCRQHRKPRERARQLDALKHIQGE
ncbi:MAG TPA: hypothetical protein VLH85_02645 [Levilinea sp.]|nr:hypothetical protein [Levilinea sp.]